MSERSTICKKLSAVILTVLLIVCFLVGIADASADIAGTAHFDMDKMRLTIYARCTETLIGDICADAVRELADTDLALIRSGLLVKIFHNGEVSTEDLKNVFSEDEEIYVGAITTQQLKTYLEHAVSQIKLNEELEVEPESSDNEDFAQISGFSFEYDASAAPYQRITKIMIGSSETDLQDDKTLYSIAVPFSSLNENTGFSPDGFISLNLLLSDALTEYIRKGKGNDLQMNRIQIIGAPEKLVRKYPVLPIAAGLVIIIVLVYFWRRPTQRS